MACVRDGDVTGVGRNRQRAPIGCQGPEEGHRCGTALFFGLRRNPPHEDFLPELALVSSAYQSLRFTADSVDLDNHGLEFVYLSISKQNRFRVASHL